MKDIEAEDSSPEHNFDSWATKTIGWPDRCHSKSLAKLKIIQKEMWLVG